MRTFLLLYFLGNAFCQVETQVKENSTQMHYIKLKIEFGAIQFLTDIQKLLVINSNLTVNNLHRTTICQNESDGSFLCTCEKGHKWSEEICKSHPHCCGKEECRFLKKLDYTCVSENRVLVKGFKTLRGFEYAACLSDKDSEEFQNCNNNLIKEMKTEYSRIPGFDSITITNYREGSIIVDFESKFATSVVPQDLVEISKRLSEKLDSSCYLSTTGVVTLKMPENPVHYYSQHQLTCSVKYDLEASVTWSLKRDDKEYEITTGSESTVIKGKQETIIKLLNTSELWGGKYMCAYNQSSDACVIIHEATAVLDVCHKPNIHSSLDPSFPHCKKSSDVLDVYVKCEIGNTTEDYTVTWERDSDTEILPIHDSRKSGGFRARTVVRCNSTKLPPQLTCTLKNRCSQSTSASIHVYLIREHDKFCEAEGEWQKTKASFTAILRCIDESGTRQRKCSSEAVWEPEVSECVIKELHDVLQQASIVDIGLGSLDKNTEIVFKKLEEVTNDTKMINTAPNLNTSVNVLHTMSLKLKEKQEGTVDDFLGSSSNLLEKSLEDSWEASSQDDDASLAEKYLISVEQIIHMTKITRGYEKKNVEVASKNCSQELECVNKVFNTTVDLKGLNPGSVVTAGFKELEHYLPNNRDNYEPNSYVISTTTEINISDSVEVEIKFALIRPRRPHFEMICVAWDNETKAWSDYKCEWKVSKGVCVCKHLSSFIVLMGKLPLEVKWSTEMTYVGLSVSVVSLVISLVIELTIWGAVVKTSTSYLRHTAHVNICLCLLVADCCFLASSKPEHLSPVWCKTSVVLKHFCYLAMFFWMLWLSGTLLHQTLFLFHNVSKKTYLKLSVFMGYVCPLLIVTTTYITYKAGAEGQYFSKETCWLVYTAPFEGSIHTFVIPVGIIAFFNVFAMLVVIMKLLDHPKNMSAEREKEKKAVVTVMRTVVLLTPVFGVTWLSGFAVMLLDLTYGPLAYAANYIFILLNAFQGLFILLTITLGDTMTREELLRRIKLGAPSPPNESCSDSTVKK